MLVGFIFIAVFALVSLGAVTWYHTRMLQSIVLQHAKERSTLEDRVADAMNVPRPTYTPYRDTGPEVEAVSTPNWYAHVGRAVDKVPDEWVEKAEDN